MNRNFMQCTESNIEKVIQSKPALVYHLRDVGGDMIRAFENRVRLKKARIPVACYQSATTVRLMKNDYVPSIGLTSNIIPASFLVEADNANGYAHYGDDLNRNILSLNNACCRAIAQQVITMTRILGFNYIFLDNLYYGVRPDPQMMISDSLWTELCLNFVGNLKNAVLDNGRPRWPIICNVAVRDVRQIPEMLKAYSAVCNGICNENPFHDNLKTMTDAAGNSLWQVELAAYEYTLRSINGFRLYLLAPYKEVVVDGEKKRVVDEVRYQRCLKLTETLWNQTGRIFVAAEGKE